MQNASCSTNVLGSAAYGASCHALLTPLPRPSARVPEGARARGRRGATRRARLGSSGQWAAKGRGVLVPSSGRQNDHVCVCVRAYLAAAAATAAAGTCSGVFFLDLPAPLALILEYGMHFTALGMLAVSMVKHLDFSLMVLRVIFSLKCCLPAWRPTSFPEEVTRMRLEHDLRVFSLASTSTATTTGARTGATAMRRTGATAPKALDRLEARERIDIAIASSACAHAGGVYTCSDEQRVGVARDEGARAEGTHACSRQCCMVCMQAEGRHAASRVGAMHGGAVIAMSGDGVACDGGAWGGCKGKPLSVYGVNE
jgi:hypothetical protein